ncbi:hypothetical protein RhiXN_08187 [Rhizoctonia solani]|uniref:Uncharacterized protein n=1 Tax=Rhizoctonia solani TaxID=456999 RepID=A0A8H8P3A8_9AGAM|nr:uncharacterized protein RhiXN_08187 [Rhizoctonia solani]QRW23151.1 hypothetical protein RhiXN_08187 [Rhizoctonia solani]
MNSQEPFESTEVRKTLDTNRANSQVVENKRSSIEIITAPHESPTPEHPADHETGEDKQSNLNPRKLKSYAYGIQTIAFFYWTNIGLIIMPFAFAHKYLFPDNNAAIIVTNFIALVGMSGPLSLTWNQIALYVGGFTETMIFEVEKNLIELIFAVALTKFSLLPPAEEIRASGKLLIPNHDGQSNRATNYPSGYTPAELIINALLRRNSSANRGGEEVSNSRSKRRINIVVAFVGAVVFTVLTALALQYLWESLDKVMLTSDPENPEEQYYRISPKFLGVIRKTTTSIIPLIQCMAQFTWIAEVIKDGIHNRLDDVIDTQLMRLPSQDNWCKYSDVIVGYPVTGSDGLGPGNSGGLFLINHSLDCFVLFLSVLVINYVIHDGKSNWFEGTILLSAYPAGLTPAGVNNLPDTVLSTALYIVFAIAFWFHPEKWTPIDQEVENICNHKGDIMHATNSTQ